MNPCNRKNAEHRLTRNVERIVRISILHHLLLEAADNLADETSLDAIGLDHATVMFEACIKQCIAYEMIGRKNANIILEAAYM